MQITIITNYQQNPSFGAIKIPFTQKTYKNKEFMNIFGEIQNESVHHVSTAKDKAGNTFLYILKHRYGSKAENNLFNKISAFAEGATTIPKNKANAEIKSSFTRLFKQTREWMEKEAN